MEGFYGKMVEYIPDLWKLQEEPHLMENKAPDGSVNDSEDSNHIIILLTNHGTIIRPLISDRFVLMTEGIYWRKLETYHVFS